MCAHIRDKLLVGVIIIITDLNTLLSVYLLGNLNLTYNVSGIRLSQGKEIHPIPYGQEVCPRNLLTI